MADINVTVSIDAAISITVDTNAVPPLISQAEAEAGTDTGERVVSAERIAQAIAALETAHPTAASQSEAETGTESGLRSFSPLRIAQAIAALELANVTPGGSDKQFQYNNNGAFGGYTDQNTTTFANPCSIDCVPSRNHKVTITGDVTINLTNHAAGMSGVICLLNDGSGGHAVTLGTMFTKELNGSDDYDNTASKYNLVSWYYDGTNVLYSITNEA